jgi:S-DNA-T family DNA segregation ATPase FtsK/SpoIIIE
MENNQTKKPSAYSQLTGFRRAVPIILFAFAAFLALCFILQDTGAFGRAISDILLGLFSIGGYFIPAFIALHAVFYPSDVLKKRILTRIIFTTLTVIAIAALCHVATFHGEPFSAKAFYENGTCAKGGGFIGGAVEFALTKVFGTVGLIIITIAFFALYVTYYFSSAKSFLIRLLLKLLNAISALFTSMGHKMKTNRERKKREREQRRIEQLAEEHEALTEDEFFNVDNGLKHLKINDLGIDEMKDDEDLERNPHLQDRVIKNDPIDTPPKKEEPTKQKNEDSAPADKKRRVNLDYGTFDSKRTLSNSTKDSEFKQRPNDIILDPPTEPPRPTEPTHKPAPETPVRGEPKRYASDSDSSADSVFSSNFEPFDFKINEELSNKPSSKALKNKPEPEGINEIATPLADITEEDVEKARQRADEEMKRRMAEDAERRFAEAKERALAAERERKRREDEARLAQNAPKVFYANEPEVIYNSVPETVPELTLTEEPTDRAQSPAPTPTEAPTPTPAPVTEPTPAPIPNDRPAYIPDYMKEDEKPAEPPKEEIKDEEKSDLYKLSECFANAINEYESKKNSGEFKPYTPPTVAPTEDERADRQPEEMKITRTMLDPTPTVAEPIEEDDGEDEVDYSNVNFDSYADVTEDEEEEEEIKEFDFSGDDPSDDGDDTEEEIPPHLQNENVIEQRKLFPFLDEEEKKNEETTPDEDEKRDYIDTSFEDISDGEPTEPEEEDEDEDEPPFDAAPPKSTFAERMLSTKPAPKPEPKPEPTYEKPDYSDYQYPSVELLAKGKFEEDLNQEEEKNQNAEKLVDALLQFNVRISIKGIDRGPRITRYEIVPARGVKVNSVTNLFNDIALNLGVEGMRMEAPIPGKSAIGVEIPNKKPSTVLLRDLVESDEFICSPSKTMSCLGKDVTGNPVFADIAKMPHVLVAGATGMGKSVCINSILISILYKARPDEVKFIMIDPKKVEFNGYNGIPHLLIPVVTDVKQAAGALMWAVEQMEKRYDLMEALEVRKLDSYNEKVRENPELGEPLPKIIIVIDELNDIMLQVRKPAEDLIMSIAQKARAAGIHLIIGTQRPSVDVITGVIKANIPSRISCKVASYNDSKTILEQAGAEKLLNNGDMLYISAGAPKALRVQGAFVSDGEVTAIMKFLKTQAKGQIYDAQALEEINKAAQKCSKGKGGGDDLDDDDDDDGGNLGFLNDQQFLDAVDLAIKSGKISTSLIQRRISVGYGKAAKFIDIMEDMGIVSEPNGQKPREILITKDEWHEMLSRRSLD